MKHIAARSLGPIAIGSIASFPLRNGFWSNRMLAKLSRVAVRASQVAIALWMLAQAASAQMQSSKVRGQEIAERLCAGCHDIYGQQQRLIEGTAIPSFSAIAARPDRTAAALRTFMMTPHRPMPGIELGQSEVHDLVSYILSLK